MSERFSRYATKPLQVNGFDALTRNQQHFLYHLHLAGIVARDIRFMQTGRYALDVKNVLEDMYLHGDLDRDERKSIEADLHLIWLCGGYYHESDGDRITPNTPAKVFLGLLSDCRLKTSLEEGERAYKGLYSKDIPSHRYGRDGERSGFVTHDEDITDEERKQTLDMINDCAKSLFGDQSPLMGVNAHLCRDTDGNIVVERFSIRGPHGDCLRKVVHQLSKALVYVPHESLAFKNIQALITFYNTGNPLDFDKASIAALKDDNSVYFSNGYIETYEDPLKQQGSFQSIVGFKDPEVSKRIDAILAEVQYIEDNLPVGPEFRRKEAKGLSALVVDVLSFSGASTVMPIGHALPNNDWIKETIGCKSVIFGNVLLARAIPERKVFERFLLPEYHDNAELYLEAGISLWIYLHECAGHPSGKLAPGVQEEDLGEHRKIIEESRADLVALHTMGDRAFLERVLPVFAPEISAHEHFLKVAYAQYLTDATLFQLTRTPESSDELEMTHFRNRQINAKQVLVRAILSGGVRWVNGCLEILNVEKTREAFTETLTAIQTIKSTADLKEAKYLVEEFGTKINLNERKAANAKIDDLDLPSYIGFYCPYFQETGCHDKPYRLLTPPSFTSDQLAQRLLAKGECTKEITRYWNYGKK